MNPWTLLSRAAFVCLAVVLLSSNTLVAQNDNSGESNKDLVDFERDVQPIFAAHCHACHGPEKQESNFRLDVKSRALGTADFGDPPIIPGNSAGSPLIEFVSGDDPDFLMPPEGAGARLDRKQLETLRRWIDEGATWPDKPEDDADNEVALTTDHWSFQSIVDPALPEIEEASTPRFPIRNGIDSFVARLLAKNGLQASEPADRVTLIRRVYLDMHGLQPTPEQVKAFVDNQADEAYASLVDDVLASHHYGERWARHWLDVVRFGESTGYEVNRDRANAWYFRDYVIDSLNHDKSYRDFIIEQLAGDALAVDEATGFLVGGPYDIVKSPDINLTLMQREDELADYVDTTSTAFLGLTVGCARCHNHKFDPILQKDYYSLQAIFAGVAHGERVLSNRVPPEVRDALNQANRELQIQAERFANIRESVPPPEKITADLLPMVNGKLNTDSFDSVNTRFLRFTILRTNASEPCLDELEIHSTNANKNVALASLGSVATSSGDYPGNPKHKLEHINDGKFGNDFSWISNSQGKGWIQIELPKPIEVNRVLWARDRQGMYADRLAIDYRISISLDGVEWQEVAGSAGRKPFLIDEKEPEDAFISRLPKQQAAEATQLFEQIGILRAKIKELNQSIPVGYVGTFKTPKQTHRLYRGDPLSPREAVVPDILTVMGSLGMDNETPEQTRRLMLAKWIAAEDNPLTARVIVNRVWHYHFGTGIVSTPSDFGKNGTSPSHPELLDWLALRFMENGWSLKWLHREILLSSTWRQSSHPRSRALAKDADCRLLWRFPPRRLEAEAIRDCVLQLSGKLNPETGGPGFLLFKIDRENVHHYFPLEKFEPEHFRRMIYMTKIRQEQDEVFGVFDCPDGGQTIPDRSRSTTALQALNLLNSKFILEQTGFLAARLENQAGDRIEDQLRLAFELAFSRQPSVEELADATAFVEQHGLQAFCRALLNANEFLFMS